MADSGDEQDLFSFDYSRPDCKAGRGLALRELRQVAFGFLCSLKPDGAAMDVPVCFRKYQVAAAGFWRGAGGRHKLEKSAVVVLHQHLEHCFAECSDRDSRLAAIHKLCAEKEALEAVIRRTEPELISCDDLFSDFRTWDYASSVNPEYRTVCRKLDKLRNALQRGSRLERIRGTGVADLCYLAVPEGLVAPDEIAFGWGLVYLTNDRKFKLMREPDMQKEVTPEGRQLLAQNIAASAFSPVCFAAGVDCAGKSVSFRKTPRRRGRL